MSLFAALEAKLAKLKESCVSEYPLPRLRIGAKTAELAIVQGGMGVGISLSNLAAAVAREGGIGVIAANAIGMIEADYYADPVAANLRALRREIREARRLSTGVIGVNIMVAVDCFRELLDAAVEENVDVLFLGAGLPIKGIPVQAIRRAGVQVVPIVSSARAARLIFKSWEKAYQRYPRRRRRRRPPRRRPSRLQAGADRRSRFRSRASRPRSCRSARRIRDALGPRPARHRRGRDFHG